MFIDSQMQRDRAHREHRASTPTLRVLGALGGAIYVLFALVVAILLVSVMVSLMLDLFSPLRRVLLISTVALVSRGRRLAHV